MSERNDYIIYDQLAYLWKKKWILLLIPIIIAVAAYAVTALSNNGYEGKAVFNTATIKEEYLTEPDMLEKQYAKYGKGVKVKFDVMQTGRVKLEVTGKDKKAVADTVNKISADLSKGLIAKYDTRVEITERYMNEYKAQNKELKASLEILREDLENGKAEPYEGENSIAYVIAEKEKMIKELTEKISRNETDLDAFEKPELLEQTVAEKPKAIKANTVIAFVLSFILTLFALLVWKYISEARRVRHG